MHHGKVVQLKIRNGAVGQTLDLFGIVSQAGGNVLVTLHHGDDYVLATNAVRAASLGGQIAT